MYCRAITQAGRRCSRLAKRGGLCTQHISQGNQLGGGLSPDKILLKYGTALRDRLVKDRSYREDDEVETLPQSFIDADFKGKYLEWIVKSYIAGGIRLYEDLLSRVRPGLEDFTELVKSRKLKLGNPAEPWTNEADINNYCGLAGCKLKDKERLGLDSLLSKYQEVIDDLASKGDKFNAVIYDGKAVKIYAPKTEDESCYYGQGTKWCTAAKKNNMFEDYFDQGPLYIIVPKHPSYKGEKYQLHNATKSYMNEKDEAVELMRLLLRYPEVNKLLYDIKITVINDFEVSIIFPDGAQEWYRNGELHRDGDKPAKITVDGTQLWYRNGELHRDGDKPAKITADGEQRWYRDGELHRDGDKPAVIFASGIQLQYRNGEYIPAHYDAS